MPYLRALAVTSNQVPQKIGIRKQLFGMVFE